MPPLTRQTIAGLIEDLGGERRARRSGAIPAALGECDMASYS